MTGWVSVGLATALVANTAGVAAADTVTVTIKGLKFGPQTVSARVGDTIEWINRDFVAHTATARGGDWDITIAPGATGRTVLDRAGDVAYFCRLHPNMTGRISVAAE